MLHLTDAETEELGRILERHLPGTEVWAFGSRVSGKNLKPFSDLDLAVISDPPLTLSRLATLQAAFAESTLPFRVDIVDLASIEPAFRKDITDQHLVVQQG